MKKLSVIVLALTACIMLSACDENTTTSQQATVHQPNIDEITSNNASGYASTDSDYSSAADSDYSSATSSAADSSAIASPTKPEMPQVEAISPSKLEYEFVNKGDYGAGIKITGINTAAEDIRFPDTIDGEPVVYIGSSVEYSTNVKTLIFPDTVGDCGFIPKTVEFVKLPEGVTSLENIQFPDKSNLKSIILPNGITNIPSSMFKDCSNLVCVTLGDNITSIDEYAFKGCESLIEITVPDSVTNIGRSAFESCSSLHSVIIPDSVSYIGNSAFSDCTNLTDVVLDGGFEVSGPEHTTFVFSGCKNLTNVTIGNNMTHFYGMSIFSYCDSLTRIDLPENIVDTNKGLFSPSSITSITYKGKTYTMDEFWELEGIRT